MHVERKRATAAARKPEVLAVLAGCLVVVLGFVVIRGLAAGSDRSAPRTGAAQHRQHQTHRVSQPPHPTDGVAERSKVGAVGAATRDLQTLSAAAVEGGTQARRAISAIAIGSLQAKLERAVPPIAGEIQARLDGSSAPGLFAGWPLAFRMESFDGFRAVVAVWHLDVGASSALALMTASYTTTTYDLVWTDGSWRVTAISSVPGPTPPSPSAPAAEVDEFAREANALTHYAYVP